MARELLYNVITGFAGSAFGALVSGYFKLNTARLNILADHITGERAAWREVLRVLTIEVIEAAQTSDVDRIRRLRASFALRLNPLDFAEDDRAILRLIFDIEQAAGSNQNELLDLEKLISAKLKNDWERSKREARGELRTTSPCNDVVYDPSRRIDNY